MCITYIRLYFSELNDTEFTRPYYNMTVHNQHWTTLVYNLSSIGAATVNPFVEGDDSVQISAQYTTNYGAVRFRNGHTYTTSMLLSIPPGQSAVVQVKFSPPADAKPHLFPIFSGFVTVTTTGAASSSPKVSVPYAGMVGRWKQAPVWSRQSAQLGSPTGVYDIVTGDPISDNGTVNATSGALLAIVASTSSRFGEVQVLKHPDNTRYIVVAEFLDANFAPVGVYSFSYVPLTRMVPIAGQSNFISAPNYALWHGLAITNSSSNNNIQLPAGLYTISFVAQKHFANATDPLDTVSTTFYLTA